MMTIACECTLWQGEGEEKKEKKEDEADRFEGSGSIEGGNTGS